MKASFLAVFIPSLMLGAVDNLRVIGATSAQIIVQFTRPDTTGACTVEASTSSGFTSLAIDVDPNQFAGADSCSRAGNIVNGRVVTAVIGKRGDVQGLSAFDTNNIGWWVSRALRADTQYFIRVTASGDSATTVARTTNIPMGSTNGDALAAASPFEYKRITANPVAMPEFNDPYTGALTKQYAPLLGFYYAASTVDSGLMALNGADCNQTLTGVKGSCKFLDATGAAWGFTSGSLTTAIRADDNNYVTYSGTSQEEIFIRLGPGHIPNNTSLEEVFSWQNLIFKGKTSDATGGGGEFEFRIALDYENGVYGSPWRTVTFTTSDSIQRACNDSPCTNPEVAGDFMTFQNPAIHYPLGKSRIYNEAGSLNVIKFTGDNALADCNRLYVGEAISAQNTAADTSRPYYGFTVSSKSCGSSPPQFTSVETGNSIAHNGTTGVPYWTGRGIGSYHYGIVVRKKSTTSNSTISLDYVLWRAAWSAQVRFNWASGGFGKKCQTVPTAGGYFLCVTELDGGLVIGIKPNAAGNGLDVVQYGTPYFRGDLLPGMSGILLAEFKTCTADAGNSFTWDDTTPGRFYCGFRSLYPNPAKGGAVDNRNVIMMLDMALTERGASDPDGYGSGTNRSIVALSAVRLLTPCYNGCLVTTDDFTPYAQLRRLDLDFKSDIWGNCDGSGGPLGDVLFGGCRPGQQNYPSYTWALDLGNRLPPGGGYVASIPGHGTDQMFAKFSTVQNVATPWCGGHTGQSPDAAGGAVPLSVNEVNQAASFGAQGTALSSCNAHSDPGTCSACPNVTVGGYSYTSSNLWCSTITMSSSWPGGGAPGYFTPGDPIKVSGADISYNWIKPWEVGDFLYNGDNGGEIVRILAKSGTLLTILRGWGGWLDSGHRAVAHNNGSTWTGICNAVGDDPKTANTGQETASPAWYFKLDWTGTDSTYTFKTHIHNHAFHFGDAGMTFGYGVKPNAPTTYSGLMVAKFPLNDYASYKNLFYGGWAEVGQPTSFAGKPQWPYGNALETHPGAQHALGSANALQWFHDIRVRSFSGSTMTVTRESGKNHIYYMGGSGLLYNPKFMDQEVWTSNQPLKRSDTLTDNGAGAGYYCNAIVANDCFTGSIAGRAYFSSDIYDTTWGALGGCRDTIFQPLNGDICLGNAVGVSAAVVQTKFPPANATFWPNGMYMRVVAKEGRTYREAPTENVHSDPLGKVLLYRDYRYVYLPDFPTADSVNRSTWIPVVVNIPSTVSGTSTAVVEFGYNDSFQCSTNRDNFCVAQSASIPVNDPYLFSHETISGLACASSCSITIPALSNRVLYWRYKLRDAGGATLFTSPVRLKAVL